MTNTSGARWIGRAPLRISFAGGSTDIEPYPSEHGGCVLSSTVNLYCQASLELAGELRVTDLNSGRDCPPTGSDGNRYFVHSVMSYLGPSCSMHYQSYSSGPPGSGLGSSGSSIALCVAMVRAAMGLTHDRYIIANEAYIIEKTLVGTSGGRQDEFAATFGGFNFIEFGSNKTFVNPLRIDRDVQVQLESLALLVNTGISRSSSTIIDKHKEHYKNRPDMAEHLHEMKACAIRSKDHLLKGEVERFLGLLDEGWELKKAANPDVTNERIDYLYARAKASGAISGKLLGAGQGGHFLFFVDIVDRQRLVNEMERHGCSVVPFSFEERGIEVVRVSG